VSKKGGIYPSAIVPALLLDMSVDKFSQAALVADSADDSQMLD